MMGPSDVPSVRLAEIGESSTVPQQITDPLATLRTRCQDLFIEPSSLKVVHRIGEGQFATVKLAKMSVSDTERLSTMSWVGNNGGSEVVGGPSEVMVAVKRLKPSCFENPRDVADFLAEAHVCSKVKHTNIVRFLGVGADEPVDGSDQLRVFIVQEYMNQGTLTSVLMKQMRNPHSNVYEFQDALRWAKELARALRYLHRCKPLVLHRDLKADNVLLSGLSIQASVAKLSDFGLAALLPPYAPLAAAGEGREGSQRRGALYASGSGLPLEDEQLMLESQKSNCKIDDLSLKYRAYELTGKTGSLTSMAPEVTLHQPYNEKVDVFSFGIILFELFSKRLLAATVTTSGSPMELEMYAMRVASGYREKIPTYWPPELAALVTQCWSSDPLNRPTIEQVYKTLEELDESGSIARLDARLNAGKNCCCVM